jgi:hypothetical protein
MNEQENYFHFKKTMESAHGKRLFFDDNFNVVGECEINPKKFEVGKAYQHSSGKQLYICGEANTLAYGLCLIAECGWNKHLLKLREEEWLKEQKENDCIIPSESIDSERFSPVSRMEGATDNYFEIPVKEFIANNFEK